MTEVSLQKKRKRIVKALLFCVSPFFALPIVQILDEISISESSALGSSAMIGSINVAPWMFLLTVVGVIGMAIGTVIAVVVIVYWIVLELKSRQTATY